jgi:branched-chain amino acid aminotransferase
MTSKIKVTKTRNSRLNEVDFDNIPFGKVFTDHMFEIDYKDGVWQDPSIKPFHDLTLHPATMALHYGQSIFEGMKASVDAEGNPLLFRPEEHAKRINYSARRMCMPELPEELFLEAIKKLTWLDQDWIPKQEGSAMYLRPIMFATDEYIGVAPSNSYKFLIIALPVGPYYSKPVKLVAEHEYVRAVRGGVGEAKTCGNYAASMLPAQKAKAKGYDQVLWLDAHEFKYIQEVGTMNIFFVIDGKVVTPATEGAILRGITRKSIIELLKADGYEVEERKVSIDEIKEAYEKGILEEVFGSGTAAVIAHVSEVADGDFQMSFSEEDWTLSKKVKKQINGMRNGTIEDKFDWIVSVKDEVLVS